MNAIDRMSEIIGLSPVKDKIPFVCVETVDCGAYARSRIEYKVNGRIIYAYLLIPKGEGIFPAVLVNHQHNRELNLGKSEVCGIEGNPLQAFGSALAEKGFVVISPDAICFEDRRANKQGTVENKEQDDWNYFLALCNGILTGETLSKIAIEDAMGAISVLNSLEFVDRSKIGCMGHSYGGNTTYFTTAFDKRIRYALSSGSVVSYKIRIENNTGIEKASIIPGFIKEFEIADVIKEIAPRSFMIVCASEDKWSKDAPEIYEIAKENFMLKGAEGKLEIKQYPGGHAITPERFEFIIDWIYRQGRGVRCEAQ